MKYVLKHIDKIKVNALNTPCMKRIKHKHRSFQKRVPSFHILFIISLLFQKSYMKGDHLFIKRGEIVTGEEIVTSLQ